MDKYEEYGLKVYEYRYEDENEDECEVVMFYFACNIGSVHCVDRDYYSYKDAMDGGKKFIDDYTLGNNQK